MERNKQRQYSIRSIDHKLQTGQIRDDHPLQRMSMQHSNAIRDGIIASAISDRYIPEVILCEQRVGEKGEAQYWLIDGKQRWTELAMYRRNQFKLGRNIEDPIVSYRHVDEKMNITYVDFDIRGKKYSDLPQELRERYDNFEITGQIFLDCSEKEIEGYIRRFNNTKPMTVAQKGITYIGEELARAVKRLSGHDFFRENIGKFSDYEMRSGKVERLITEAIMLISYPEKYSKSQEKNCEFLRGNAPTSVFDTLEEYLDRLVEVLPLNARNENLCIRDGFVWLALFDRFQKYGKSDEDFADFLEHFDGLKDTVIDGMSWNDIIATRGTKDKGIVMKKLSYLETMMRQYLNLAEIKEEEIASDNEIFNTLVKKTGNSIVSDFVSGAELQIIVAEFLSETFGNSDGVNLAEFVSWAELPETIVDDFSLCLEIFEDWTLDVNNNSKLLNKYGIPAILTVINSAIARDIDDIGKEWFIQFVDKYDKGFFTEWENNFDWICRKLMDSFDEFAKYRKTA